MFHPYALLHDVFLLITHFILILIILGENLGMKPKEVLSADGAEIDDLDVIRDNECLHFLD